VQIRGGPVADYAAARPIDDCGSPKENMFTKSAGARVSTPEVVGPCRTRFLCCCCSASDPTEPMVRIGQKMGNDQSSMKLEIGNHAQVIGALSDVSIYPAHPSSPVKSSPTSPRNTKLPPSVPHQAPSSPCGSLGLDSGSSPTSSGDGLKRLPGKKFENDNEAISNPRRERLCQHNYPGSSRPIISQGESGPVHPVATHEAFNYLFLKKPAIG